MGKTMDVKIPWEGKEEVVTLKKLTYGEYNQLIEEATTVKLVGKLTNVNVSQKNLQELGLVKSIIKSPFANNIESVRNLELEVGQMLFEAFSQLNNIGDVEKKQ